MNIMAWALSGLGVVSLVLGTVLSLSPLWKSATLSPDCIQRRVFWTGSALAVVLFFLASLPNWRSGLFVSVATAVAIGAIAFKSTNHIKINGRIYAMPPSKRAPDRPPALAPDVEDQ